MSDPTTAGAGSNNPEVSAFGNPDDFTSVLNQSNQTAPTHTHAHQTVSLAAPLPNQMRLVALGQQRDQRYVCCKLHPPWSRGEW